MLGTEELLAGLVGKFVHRQFKVKEDDLWQEDPWILDLKVLSSRALIKKLFDTSHEFLTENIIGAQLAYAVTDVHFRHFAPTPLGCMVTLRLTVEKVEKNHIFFQYQIFDEFEEISNGSFTRVVVSREAIRRSITQKIV